MSSTVPTFDELIATCTRSAVHLEMRDSYGVDDEAADFERWRATRERDVDPASAYWAPWVDLIGRTRARGVTVRRARIVSEPVTEYIRYEYAGTPVNVAAGELVRWLPRRRASDLALPGNDFWLFDEEWVHWNHFTGDGASTGAEIVNSPEATKLCASAFEAVWDRAVPHDQYEI
ncbi:DUF6879 family protein [Actinacidiphila sp. bgisy145]|uniref:DUF6879 family protein n=1 Tax=Actinacidiphila sp. bgisy145 TaxID=3413792 RepID=UPI003EB85E42